MSDNSDDELWVIPIAMILLGYVIGTGMTLLFYANMRII